MLTVHHLGKSQSERIVWLCKELAIPYELKRYARDPVTMQAPADYKALHAIGAAPVINDGDLVLAESGAVDDYIMAKYRDRRLALNSSHRDFAQYLYWFHFANGTLQSRGSPPPPARSPAGRRSDARGDGTRQGLRRDRAPRIPATSVR
jgi:glutathione S-transferase